jgi:hypothetical protein
MMFKANVKTPAEQPEKSVRIELDRLLSLKLFAASPALKALLRFVVEETLAGNQSGIKESVIATQVFHRGHGFDPRADSIVRVQASILRRKLAAAYAEPGVSPGVRIVLPTGGYVPRFEMEKVARPPSSRWRPIGAVSAALVSLLAIGTFLIRWNQDSTGVWDPLLHGRVPTRITYGTPPLFSLGGVLVRDIGVNSPGDLRADSAVSRLLAHLGRGHEPVRPAASHYTGVGEAAALERLSRFFLEHHRSVQVLHGEQVKPNELPSGNLIVISSLRFHTVVQTLNLPADFTYTPRPDSNIEVIRNLRPQIGEEREYVVRRPPQDASTEYALMGVWPSASGSLVFIGGTLTWATYGAVEFMTSPAGIAQVQQHIAGNNQAFQCLFRVTVRNFWPVDTQLVAVHRLGGFVARNEQAMRR